MMLSLTSVGLWQRPLRSRGLAYALLILIGFTSTVGLTHRHGSRQPKLSPNTVSFTRTSSLPQVNAPASTTRDSSRSSDCLICQFQQNLSSAEVFTPEAVHAATGSAAVFRQTSLIVLSKTRRVGHGRAPPTTS